MNQSVYDKKLVLNRINDQLYLNEERYLLVSSNSFGILQRDLIKNIGMERMKTFFFQYGWNIGAEDGKEIAKDLSMSIKEKILYCTVTHTFKGHVQINVTDFTIKMEGNRVSEFYIKGTWENSYEAEQHLKNLGIAAYPVCYTLTGYASGAVSQILGEKVFFKELECMGQGLNCCIWEGKLVSDWGQEVYQEFIAQQNLPILKELEQTYAKLVHEKEMLSKVMEIEHKLTESIVKGSSVRSILEIVEKYINKPIVVEDVHQQMTEIIGMTSETYEPLKQAFLHIINGDLSIKKTTLIKHSNFTRLVSPVFLQENIVGYCSFLYEKDDVAELEIDSLIITGVAKMCSLIFLNEKVELESTERMKGYFFDEIMNGKYQSEQEVLKKAFFINLDFSDGYYAIHVKYADLNKHDNPQRHTKIFEYVTRFMSDNGMHVLMDSLLLLLPRKQLGEREVEQFIHPFLTFLQKRISETVFFVGVSSMHTAVLEEVKEALKEAQTAVMLATKENPIMFFHELGILGVLVNDENKQAIRKIAQLTLGDLYKNMDESKQELLGTLYAFLSNGGSFEQTAERMAISISGLRYRLNKITNLLGSDLRDPETRFQLLLSLKALLLVEEDWLPTRG